MAKMESRYPSTWNLKIDAIQGDDITVRSNLTCLNDANEWVKDFGAKNNTGWIVGPRYRKGKSSTRYELHKRWVCQRNGANKVAGSHRSTSCKASIDILIKMITRNTKRTDSYLKMSPPLQAVIKIIDRHNHFTDTAESLSLLRGASDTKAAFEEYFNNGMAVAEARRFHQEVLQANDSSDNLLDNSSINPTSHTVYYWHHCHRVKAASNCYSRASTMNLAEIHEKNEQEGPHDPIQVKEEPLEDSVDVNIEGDKKKLEKCVTAKNSFIFVDQSAWKTECRNHTDASLEDDPLFLKQEPELYAEPQLEHIRIPLEVKFSR